MNETITFFLTWEEFFAAQEFFRRSRQNLAPEWIVGVLLILLSALFFIIGGANVFVAGALILGIVVIVGAPFLRRYVSRWKWQREPLYETEHEIGVGEDGIYFRMGRIESNLTWSFYQRLLENETGFLLVYSNDSFNLLPKRAFTNEQFLNEFRALTTKRLKQ